MHIHKAIWALKIKVALKIQMSLRKLSGKVSAAAAGDGGVPYMLCVCVCVCVCVYAYDFLSVIKWCIPRHLRTEQV